MQRHLQEQHIRGATLAVSRNGKLLIQRGYGFKDAEEQEAMPPDAMLRIASVTKPITAIAIQKLIAEKKIDGDTKVREYLEIQPPDGATVDPRWDKITIQNLLSHRGGWDRSAAQEGHDDGFDPMFFPELVGKTLGEAPPLKPVHFVRFMLGQPLQFEPGERYEYSNFGYCVLGRVIEKASGMSYGDFIAKEICDPLGATDVKIGRSLVKDRNPREPVYAGAGVSENVLTAEHDEVRWPDGGFLLEGMDSHGGVIASAAHLAKIFDAYWIDGTPRVVGGNARWAHFGSLPGTFAVAAQRPGGLTVVVLLNQRSGKGSRDEQILKRMDEAAEQITEWPSN
jgi:N-acyl-D-amino-acid deacylase